MKKKSLHELDTFYMGDNDQPTGCPKCGSRTAYIDLTEDKQQHLCPICDYEFFLDIEG